MILHVLVFASNFLYTWSPLLFGFVLAPLLASLVKARLRCLNLNISLWSYVWKTNWRLLLEDLPSLKFGKLIFSGIFTILTWVGLTPCKSN